jgi:glycosyltransferase involved in cell wall biosynthesis
MKICFISHSARLGGAEIVLLETVEVLKDRGIDCSMLVPENGALCEELRRINVPFSVIPYGLWMTTSKQNIWLKLKYAVRHIVTIPAILWKIKRWKCDVVYSNTVSVCVGALAAAIARLPHIWHIHEFGFEDHGLIFVFGNNISYSIMNKISSLYICVSKAVASKYSKYIASNKIKTIYCSMHRMRDKRPEPDTVIIEMPTRREQLRCVIVGSVVEGKGQEEAVSAIAELTSSGVSAELLIIGRTYPGYGERLKEIVSRLRLDGRIVFLGHVDNPLPYVQSSDIVLVCSKLEAFGRVTVEAMFAGKPVIGAQSGGTAELITDGVNGLVYDLGDPKSLAGKIQYLYENKEAAMRIGQNGKVWAEEMFTKERYSKELLDILQI